MILKKSQKISKTSGILSNVTSNKILNLSPSKNTQYANVSSRYLNPRAKAVKEDAPNLSTKNFKSKTAAEEEIKQIAEKHYQQAMKYVNKKNDFEEQRKERQKQRLKLNEESLTKQHTFYPILMNNKYNKKIDKMKQKGEKHVQLTKWGQSHQDARRQQVINGQVKLLKKSLQKQYRSLDNSRNSSLDKSIERSLQKSFANTTRSKEVSTNEIPGVKKYYLNQAKAQISKTRHQKLLFRGNDSTGYYY